MQMNTQDSKWTLAGVWMVGLTIGGSTDGPAIAQPGPGFLALTPDSPCCNCCTFMFCSTGLPAVNRFFLFL